MHDGVVSDKLRFIKKLLSLSLYCRAPLVKFVIAAPDQSITC